MDLTRPRLFCRLGFCEEASQLSYFKPPNVTQLHPTCMASSYFQFKHDRYLAASHVAPHLRRRGRAFHRVSALGVANRRKKHRRHQCRRLAWLLRRGRQQRRLDGGDHQVPQAEEASAGRNRASPEPSGGEPREENELSPSDSGGFRAASPEQSSARRSRLSSLRPVAPGPASFPCLLFKLRNGTSSVKDQTGLGHQVRLRQGGRRRPRPFGPHWRRPSVRLRGGLRGEPQQLLRPLRGRPAGRWLQRESQARARPSICGARVFGGRFPVRKERPGRSGGLQQDLRRTRPHQQRPLVSRERRRVSSPVLRQGGHRQGHGAGHAPGRRRGQALWRGPHGDAAVRRGLLPHRLDAARGGALRGSRPVRR